MKQLGLGAIAFAWVLLIIGLAMAWNQSWFQAIVILGVANLFENAGATLLLRAESRVVNVNRFVVERPASKTGKLRVGV